MEEIINFPKPFVCPTVVNRTSSKSSRDKARAECRIMSVTSEVMNSTERLFFNAAMKSAGVNPESVWRTSVIKCRMQSEGKRTSDVACANCYPFISREIAIYKPEIIVLFGSTAHRNIVKFRGFSFTDGRSVKVRSQENPDTAIFFLAKNSIEWAIKSGKTIEQFAGLFVPDLIAVLDAYVTNKLGPEEVITE